MGCGQSKIENEEAISRCKERKLFMKEAVSARNAFAAAHSGYAMALKNAGAALSEYGHGEVQNPQLTSSQSVHASASSSQVPFETIPLLPPPVPNFLPSPLQRAATMPEIKIPKPDPPRSVSPTIVEEDENEIEFESNEGSLRRRGSSRGGGSRVGNREAVVEKEDGPPPPQQAPVVENRASPPPPPPPQPTQDSTWDYFFSQVENMVVEEVKIDKEKIERKAFEKKKVEESEAAPPPVAAEKVVDPPMPPLPEVAVAVGAAGKGGKKVKVGGSVEGKRMGKGKVNLLHIFRGLDDHFLKASESSQEVSKMLEATRLHYHSNFADNRGHIDHSARVMRVITWNRSFRGGVLNTDDGKDDFDVEEHETHATVLDKLLAWEKKLYDEVKEGELMKFVYQKKIASLNKQKKRGTNSEALEKTKAAVTHLHTRYIVDMQSMDSTVSEINGLRDEQLYPKLVHLVDEMATMWETMRAHLESQSKIVTDLRSLDISQSPKETSEHHYQCTFQLYAVVKEWHSQFDKFVRHQKEYIKALNSWLKLNLIPIESSLKERVSSPPRIQTPPIQVLLIAWHDCLEKLPEELARTAIYNFAAVIETIMHHQQDEIKLREKCEDTRKELARKTRQFEDWYHKYTQRRTPDELDPSDNIQSHRDQVTEKQFQVEVLKARLEEEEEAYRRQCIQVREKSLASLKTSLPELFRLMSDFSHACSDMYRELRSISQHQDQTDSHDLRDSPILN